MLRCRLFAPTTDGFTIGVFTTTDTAGANVSISLSQGSAVKVEPAQILTTAVATAPLLVGSFVVTGCSAFSRVTYTVSQTGETDVTGSPRTLPSNTTTPFSFVNSTCDFGTTQWSGNSWKELRNSSASKNILFMVHPDDYTYVDSKAVTVAPYTSGGRPDATKDPDDFHLAYGSWMGLFDWDRDNHNADRQWCYNNIPIIATGGDHYVINDYRRTTSEPIDATLYTAAKAGWDAWIGDFQAPMLLDASELWLGFTAGPCKFVFSELENTCTPYNGSDTTQQCYGSAQIADWNTYYNANTVEWNFLCSERFMGSGGQGWRQFHTTEADGWKSGFDANNNLNGTNGHFTALTGDRHAQAMIQYDTFAEFTPGQLQGQQAVGESLRTTVFPWEGELKYALTNRGFTGDVPLEGFSVIDVTSERLVLNSYQTYSGDLLQTSNTFTLLASSSSNTWSEDIKMPIYVGVLPDTSQASAGSYTEQSSRSHSIVKGQNLAKSIPANYRLAELGAWLIPSDGSERTAALAVYAGNATIDDADNGEPSGNVIAEGSLVFSGTSGVAQSVTLAVDVPVDTGDYTVSIISVSSTVNVVDLAGAGAVYESGVTFRDGTLSTPSTLGFGNPWTTAGTQPTHAPFIWARFDEIGAPSAPTLTTPYSDRTDTVGDVIADVNYQSNISGATSYKSSGFPTGIDTSDLLAAGGTLVRSGKFTSAVEGSNYSNAEGGSAGGQFIWTVSPLESLVNETAIQQVVNGSAFSLRNPDGHNIMSGGPNQNFFGVRFYSDAAGTTEVAITGTADMQIETFEAPLDSITALGSSGQRWSMDGNPVSGAITFTGGNTAHYFKVFASQNTT